MVRMDSDVHDVPGVDVSRENEVAHQGAALVEGPQRERAGLGDLGCEHRARPGSRVRNRLDRLDVAEIARARAREATRSRGRPRIRKPHVDRRDRIGTVRKPVASRAWCTARGRCLGSVTEAPPPRHARGAHDTARAPSPTHTVPGSRASSSGGTRRTRDEHLAAPRVDHRKRAFAARLERLQGRYPGGAHLERHPQPPRDREADARGGEASGPRSDHEPVEIARRVARLPEELSRSSSSVRGTDWRSPSTSPSRTRALVATVVAVSNARISISLVRRRRLRPPWSSGRAGIAAHASSPCSSAVSAASILSVRVVGATCSSVTLTRAAGGRRDPRQATRRTSPPRRNTARDRPTRRPRAPRIGRGRDARHRRPRGSDDRS